jgi:hypothetical protein
MTASHVGNDYGLTLASFTAYRPPGNQGSVDVWTQTKVHELHFNGSPAPISLHSLLALTSARPLVDISAI